MKQIPNVLRRALALVLSGALSAALALPAAAEPIGDGVAPTCDEAYYATLDYYGNLTEGSVVKSYTLNGASVLLDRGVYDEVVNLTDGTVPVVREGVTEFRFDQAPAHFYFEGRTKQPFQDLPWTISLSYALNGVAVPAEELPGRTGVVEITVDVLPNPRASDYARYNYTLEAMAVFNQDDILSLEAPGAQVQLIGNLRAVLFIALPGEEQHFTIRVGTEDFSFSGMTFLMVPATLGQLEEIAKLSQRKEDLEEDYNALSGSLDTLLDAMGDLGDSLRDTAGGLDALDQARGTISGRKDQLYADGDQIREDLSALEDSLGLLPGHLGDADGAVADLQESLRAVTNAAMELKGDLDKVDDCLEDLRRDLRRVSSSGSASESDLSAVGRDLDRLRESLQTAGDGLKELDIQINGGILTTIDGRVQQHIKIKGQPLNEILGQVQELNVLWAGLAGGQEAIGFQQFQIAALVAGRAAGTPAEAQALLERVARADTAIAQVQAAIPGTTAEQAIQYLVANRLMTEAEARSYQQAKPQLAVVEQVYAALRGGTDQTMDRAGFFAAMLMLHDINALPADKRTPEEVGKILQNRGSYERTGRALSQLDADHDTQAAAGMLTDLAALLGHLGSRGLTGSLGGLLGSAGDAMDSISDTTRAGQGLIATVDSLLDEVEDLDQVLGSHVPGLQETLRDTKTLVGDLSLAVGDSNTFLGSFRDLSRDAGEQLDAGTRESLRGLSESLRRTARSTDSVGDVRSAKDALTGIIEDTWTEYTGEVNNLLLMDATAQAVSLTSAENPAPSSVQILIRTQEIKAEEADRGQEDPAQGSQTTFWGRVAQMFRDFWAAVTGIFR